jgi:HAD superfamily hydrolase (TIGR01509 family)
MSLTLLGRPVRGVAFDMDGLLVDTERVYYDALLAAAIAVGHEMTPAFAHSMVGVAGADCVVMIQDHYGEDFAMDRFSDEYDRLVALRLETEVPLRPGARELLSFLEAQGIPKAIATSAGRSAVQRYLGGHGLLSHFAVIVTREDVARTKPAPDIYAAAVAQLGVAPAECLALEDSFHGITAAHAAGLMPIMVPDMLTVIAEIRAKCVAVVEDLGVVQRMLVAT